MENVFCEKEAIRQYLKDHGVQADNFGANCNGRVCVGKGAWRFGDNVALRKLFMCQRCLEQLNGLGVR
jgi:hypothetical protein